MNCKEHPETKAIGSCLVCNTPLCKICVSNDNLTSPQCKNCYSIDSLSENGTSQTIKTEQKREELNKQQQLSEKEKQKQKNKIKIFVIAAGLIIVIIQFGLINRAYEYSPVDKTDVVGITDYCLLNLVEISQAFDQGQMPDGEHRCPFTNALYKTSKNSGNVTISDPNPELHGFIEMSVSQDNPELLLIEDPNASDRDNQL